MCDKKPVIHTHQRKSLWQSNIITFVLLVVFIAAAFGVDVLLKPTFSSAGLLLTGVIMALIPAGLWIFFFYRQDRLEPEPKGLVLQVFILGGLLAAAVGVPLLDDLFQISSWLYSNALTTILGAVLVIGFNQEFLKYAAVRFSVYQSEEFDEPTDGVIYATAAGLGYATVLNILFVVDSGGIDLGMGAIRIVLTALAHASFCGVTGYFLGSQKFHKKPAWWMPSGITLAAVLNGAFFYVWGKVKQASISTAGGYVNPWLGLVIAVLLAAVVTFVLSRLIEREEKLTRRSQEVQS